MTDRDDRHDPVRLAHAVGSMTWRQLEQVAGELLGELELVVESNGAQRREATIARAHTGSTPPPKSPMCPCGCPSRRDHWHGRLSTARDADLAAGGTPRRFLGAVVCAAEDLRLARRGPTQRPDDAVGDMSGPERVDFIVTEWAGLPAQRAAELETARAGHIDAAAIRRIRRANGYGNELGEPREPDEDVVERIRSLHMQAHLSDREIARTLDIGRATVRRALEGHRRFDYREDAA